MTRIELVERMRGSGVLWRGCLDGVRRLVPLAVPGALVHAPLSGFVLLLLVVWAGGSAAVVDGRLDLIGASGGELLAWTVTPAALVVLAQAVVFPATVVLAAGWLVGRRVPPVVALRMAARRFPAMFLLVVLASVAYAAITAAGFGVLVVTGREWPATVVMVVLGLVAMPGLLAVPSVMLHGCTAPGAIVRAYRLVRYRELPTACTLALGVVVVPVAVVRAAEHGLEPLPGPLSTAGWAVAGTILALAVTPVQAAVVARQFLHCVAWRTETHDEDLEHGVPAGTARPVRAALWPVVLAPGLLFGGIVLVNPFGWTEVTETVVSGGEDSKILGSGAGTLSRPPSFRPWELRSAHAGHDGELKVVVDGLYTAAGVLTCADPSCERAGLAWADDVAALSDEARNGYAAALLPDGRMAVTTWSGPRLRVSHCETAACAAAPGGAFVAEARDRPFHAGVAMAVRRDGGLVVAFADRERADDGDDLVTLISCADAGCSRPEPSEAARLAPAAYLKGPPVLAVAAGPGDRPVAARFDVVTGRIHVISCADAGCRRPRVTRPVPPYPARDDAGLRQETGLALAVRADGRPVIAYRDVRDRAAKLLDCRTPDCARADVVTLDAGDTDLATPALVLDRAGRILVAFQNAEGTRIMLATCTGGRCTSTPVARIRGSAGETLAMTLDDRGRPVIVWLDHDAAPEPGWELVITTPLNLTD